MTQTTNYKLKKPADNENADIADVNNNMDIIDATMKKISDGMEESAATAGNADIITTTNTSVPASAWVTDTTYDEFPFRAAIAITGCTIDHKPDVTFSLADSLSSNFAPISETYAGGVCIYAGEKPATTIVIPTITLLKKKEAS